MKNKEGRDKNRKKKPYLALEGYVQVPPVPVNQPWEQQNKREHISILTFLSHALEVEGDIFLFLFMKGGELTWICCNNSGSACKVTGPLCLTFLLEEAIDSIRAMGSHSIWAITNSILMDGIAISPSSTSIIQCLLKGWVTHIRSTYTPICSWQKKHLQFLDNKKKIQRYHI